MKLGTALWIGLLLAAVLLATGCSSSTEPKNQNPSLPEVSPADFTILPAQSVLMTASATDPDGDAVNIHWSFSAGTPATAVGDTISWTAPATGSVTITAKARDDRGGERVATTTATVHANAAYPYGRPFEDTLEPEMDDLAETGAGFCHFNASVISDWTNTSVLVITGVPNAALLAAMAETPVWIPPATWIWSYSMPWGSSHAVVELQAALSGPASLDWQMLISGTIQNYDRFPWVTGRSSTDAIQGDWLLYDYRYPTQPAEALRVEFHRVSSTDRDLDYFNLLQSGSSYGDSLNYALHGTAAEATLARVSEPLGPIQAVWDTSDGSGRFVGATGDGCCWGPRGDSYPDVDCP
jgi:hypothetical protein